MSRTIATDMQTALQSSTLRARLLVKLEFIGSDLYLCNASTNISWNGHTWLGNGLLKPLDQITEVTDIKAMSCRVFLQALDSALVSLLLSNTNQSKKAEIYLALLDSSQVIIPDPLLIFKGNFDRCEINDSARNSVAILYYESELIRLNRVNQFRYTDQCQQAFWPGDTGFRYMPSVEDWKGFWGRAARPKPIRKRKVGRH